MRTLDANPYQMIDQKNGYTYYFNVCDNTVSSPAQQPVPKVIVIGLLSSLRTARA